MRRAHVGVAHAKDEGDLRQGEFILTDQCRAARVDAVSKGQQACMQAGAGTLILRAQRRQRCRQAPAEAALAPNNTRSCRNQISVIPMAVMKLPEGSRALYPYQPKELDELGPQAKRSDL
eukprot:6188323-Pleurochrysis_carterae.AAC.2